MLGHEEQLLYRWLTGVWAQGSGAIVELGALVGGSTACLAEGHRAAGLTSQIHAYDRFAASEALKASMLYPAGILPFGGEDILPLAQVLLEDWAPRVTFHKGEIEDQDWSGDPIEILVLDASKSTASMDRMAEMFFPALMPGAVVVQQDYLHWRQPWVAVQMWRMRDWFEPLAFAHDETLVFRCLRPVTPEALALGATDGLDDAALIADLRAARPTFAAFGVEAALNRAVAGIERSPGVRIAWQMTPP